MTDSDSSIADPEIKIVVFDLPFVIFVSDTMKDRSLEDWVAAIQGGRDPPYSRYAPCPNKPSSTIIGGGLPVYLPPDDVAPPYTVRFGEMIGVLKFIRRVNPHREMVLMGELPGDRTGRASFSTVECQFNSRMVPLEQRTNLRTWTEIAVGAVNHFIQHFRVIADRYWLYPVTTATIQEFHIGTLAPDGTTQWQQHLTGSGALNGFGGSIAAELDQKLRFFVSQPNPPDVRLVLDVQVKSYLDLGEWRLAVIETAVLFESFLTEFLRERFIAKGYSNQQTETKLRRDNGTGQPHDAIYLARHVVELAIGHSFSTTHQYRNWKEKVADVRNDLVHGRRIDATRDEAFAAFNASLDAAVLLKQLSEP